MRYSASLTIPFNTLKSSPASVKFAVSLGEITSVHFLVPSDNAGLVAFVVRYHGAQIYPTSIGNSFQGMFGELAFTDRYKLTDAPFELELRGWSPGSSYEHVVYVQLTIEPPAAELPVAAAHVALPEGFEA